MSLPEPRTAAAQRATPTAAASGGADHNKTSVTDQAVDVVLDDQLGLACGALAGRERINNQLRWAVKQQRDGAHVANSYLDLPQWGPPPWTELQWATLRNVIELTAWLIRFSWQGI